MPETTNWADTLVAWSMTWLLVSTRPFDEMTMPVPSAVSPLYFRSEVMSTRAGSTLPESAVAFSEPVPLLVAAGAAVACGPEAAEAAPAERVGPGAAAGAAVPPVPPLPAPLLPVPLFPVPPLPELGESATGVLELWLSATATPAPAPAASTATAR